MQACEGGPQEAILLVENAHVGGDPIMGTTRKEAIEWLMNDLEMDIIIMVGRIGGGMKAQAAYYMKKNGTISVVGVIATIGAEGRKMGYAGSLSVALKIW